MITCIVLLLIFLQAIVLPLNAMENNANPLKENRIIQIDREFITLTKNSRHFTNILPDERGALFRVLSSDKSKAAVIKAFDEYNVRAELIIVDLVKDEILHKGTLDHRAAYEGFALSPSGNMIAAVYKREKYPREPELIHYYHYMLAIQKIGGKQKQECCIPRLAEPLSVVFNEQGTQVVVHGTDYCSENDLREDYIIFPLNNK